MEPTIMEPTVTQNSALYLAHQQISKSRFAFFRRAAARAKLQPAIRRDVMIANSLQRSTDNGR
jgi:hypothetical protein